MSNQLQHAIGATREGRTLEAKRILADLLKTDTENVQAWFLLAMLVDSPEKKQAYLQRVLVLDPTHEKASAALGIEPAENTPDPQPATSSDPTTTTEQMSDSFEAMDDFSDLNMAEEEDEFDDWRQGSSDPQTLVDLMPTQVSMPIESLETVEESESAELPEENLPTDFEFIAEPEKETAGPSLWIWNLLLALFSLGALITAVLLILQLLN